jgi:hypothetical protein
MVVQNWADIVARSLEGVWFGVISFVPNLLGALVIFTIGLAAAASLATLVEKIFDALKLDALLEKLGLQPYFDRAGMKLHASRFLGQVVNWFLVVVFLLAAADILGLSAFSAFLKDVLSYVPNIVVAVMVMGATLVVANFARRVVTASVMGARLHAANFLGTLTWWAVTIFGLFTALVQLNVAPTILNTLLTGFIAMLALAGGLAFGLGGKGYAEHLLNRLRERTEGR